MRVILVMSLMSGCCWRLLAVAGIPAGRRCVLRQNCCSVSSQKPPLATSHQQPPAAASNCQKPPATARSRQNQPEVVSGGFGWPLVASGGFWWPSMASGSTVNTLYPISHAARKECHFTYIVQFWHPSHLTLLIQATGTEDRVVQVLNPMRYACVLKKVALSRRRERTRGTAQKSALFDNFRKEVYFVRQVCSLATFRRCRVDATLAL